MIALPTMTNSKSVCKPLYAKSNPVRSSYGQGASVSRITGSSGSYVWLIVPLLRSDELVDAMRRLGGGDASAGIAALQRLGESGNVQAQLILGGLYQHPRPTTKDVIPEPNFGEAMKWFLRASLQGSGQASAAIAEMYESGSGIPASPEKASAWWATAAKQGWDQQQLEVQCVVRKPNDSPLACDSQISGVPCLTEEDLSALRDAGLTGTLIPNGVSSRTRPGPRARAVIILDHPIMGEVTLKQPRHTNVIYIQGKTGWQMIPQDAPLLDREIALQPQSDMPQNTMVFVKDVDGSRTGASCALWR